jgi:xanthine dehydrogenase accessory factor
MSDIKLLAEKICEQLSCGLPVMVATIVSQQGSSPRHAGAKMVICADGKAFSTIGGSLLEALTIEEAKTCLHNGQSKLMDFDLTGQSVDKTGMICGGKATVMLDCVSATAENTDFFQAFQDTVLRNDDFTLLTLIREWDQMLSAAGRCMLFDDARVLGNCTFSGQELETMIHEVRHASITTVIPFSDMRVVIEPIRKIKTLYCFGAGHVAVPTAHLASLTGFRVVVIDDRSEFSNIERFPEAWDIRVIDNFSGAIKGLDINGDSFIVIFTRGHAHDRVVLEQALNTDAGYIGMISSRNKRDTIYSALMAKGVARSNLERVHSPIGLDIGAETPEEIAVSIVAELIAVRAGKIK